MTLRAAIYARVSSQEQRKAGAIADAAVVRWQQAWKVKP